ncbi:MAG: RNA-directed DNA polymerase [Candidatus Cloacimonetes bacterium]|jgi:RNA-directed DNA polymerase|nr:RNA-directed DNA polymerase [Candidatus Cloacimonadota bacterium]
MIKRFEDIIGWQKARELSIAIYQLFENIYLNQFDHFVKRDLKIRYYGRYVDDFILIHHDKAYLKSLIKVLSDFLLSTFKLTLHPKKIYLQHYSKGVKYLGAVIKPHWIYIANRTKRNFHIAIKRQNEIAINRNFTIDEQKKFISSMNSYLGIMSHYKTNGI